MTITQTTITQTQALDLWRRSLVESVRADAPDLSSRQMAILLTVYLTPPPHTVRGLAQTLNISKPAVTRALDRLGELGLLKRRPDDTDRRSVLVQRTVKGSVFLSDFAGQVMGAAQQAAEQASTGMGAPLGVTAGATMGSAAVPH
ncbi:MarR family transcriptional regulator [Oceanibaculum nanhaiense]|uniref:MarR family transcriptional regulator n=1 Tax=Oceanibaculum nanhaiense TaxID=1909734 RepID=UPI00396E5E9D